MDDIFIYMDIYRCGKIARVAVDSFVNHYPDTVLNVFGIPEDFEWLIDLAAVGKINCIDISKDRVMRKRWDIHGHWGTAHLWAKLIVERPEKYLLHLDSDVIFRGRALDEIVQKTREGFDLIGPHRNYKHNRNNRDDARDLPDVVQTCIFAFNRQMIKKHDFEELVLMCQGRFNPAGHPVIDFFDPVSFEMLRDGAKIWHLSVEDYGGTHFNGERNNSYGILNQVMGDFGRLFVHFSTVGSGLKYYTDFSSRFLTSPTYVAYGLTRYWYFCWLYYQEDLPIVVDDKSRLMAIGREHQEDILTGLNIGRIKHGVDIVRLEKKTRMSIFKKTKALTNLVFEILKKFVRISLKIFGLTITK